MNSHKQFYLWGAALIAFGAYNLYQGDAFEFALYALAGVTFIINALPYQPALLPYRRILVIASWIFIFATAVLFLYMLQFKFLQK